jgi:putative methyltransferase (TIGR04325 family)
MSAARNIARRLLSTTKLGHQLRGIPGSAWAVRNALRPAMNDFCDIFPTYHEAMDSIPASLRDGWNQGQTAENIAGYGYDELRLAAATGVAPSIPQSSTYAAFFWLDQLIKLSCRSVLDVGGAGGQTYHRYRMAASPPEDIDWTVMDVPSVVKHGRRESAKLEGPQPKLISTPGEMAPSYDIVLAQGCVQYQSPAQFADFLGMVARARYAIITKVPLYTGPDVWTTQFLETSWVPYRIWNRGSFLAILKEAGAELVASWSIRDFEVWIPTYPQCRIDETTGILIKLPGLPSPIAKSLAHKEADG